MRPVPVCGRAKSLVVALITAFVLPGCSVEAGDAAARAIADKFAADSSVQDSAPAPSSQPRPVVVLEPAREGAHPAESEEDKAAAQEDQAPPTADQRKRAETERAVADRAALLRTQAQREADEAEMLARAHAEAAERRRADEEQERKAAEARRLAELAIQENARKAEEARRVAVEWSRFEEEQRLRAAQEEVHRAAEERRLAALRQLEEEGRRRAEQVRAIAAIAEQARKPQPREPEHLQGSRLEDRPGRDAAAPNKLGGPPPNDFRAEDGRRRMDDTRVTILLVMQAGNRGIRRFNKTADPILCVGALCYVGNGAGAPAKAMTRAKAFGPGVAIGSRAGQCNRSLTCVFRNVDLERQMAAVQPIDLRILRHDRREPSAVTADPTCDVQAGHLICQRPIIAPDYMMWVVPERVAEQAGSLALEAAVRAGLPGDYGVAQSVRN